MVEKDDSKMEFEVENWVRLATVDAYPDPVADKREGKYTTRNLFINIDYIFL